MKLRSIGIRLSPGCAFYSILEQNNGLEYNMLNSSELRMPRAVDFSFQLSFLRTNIFSIIQEFEIDYAGLRIPESIALSCSTERTYMEGVIQELLSDSDINDYFVGRIAKISYLVGKERDEIKSCIDGEINLFGFDNWNNHNKENRESILTALAALNLKGDN